jgi:hypothetical protein
MSLSFLLDALELRKIFCTCQDKKNETGLVFMSGVVHTACMSRPSRLDL